jgi:hypothetical protein
VFKRASRRKARWNKLFDRLIKQDFIYVAAEDVYRCPAGERLTYRFTNQEDGKMLRRYWTKLVKAARSKLGARPALSDVSRGGSTRLCWRRFSSGSTKTPTR